MTWRTLFNITLPAPKRIPGEPRIAAGESQQSQGVFITPQSLTSFPVATAVVTFLSKVVQSLIPTTAGSLWPAAGFSFAIGAFQYVIAVSDPNSTATRREKTIGAVIALINAAYLFAASTGITAAISAHTAGATAVPTP